MRTCRVCGILGEWEWDDPRKQARFFWLTGDIQSTEQAMNYLDSAYHIGELCWYCNQGYKDFYFRRKKNTWLRRDEQILVQFVAHRLQIAARRYMKALPFTRCEAITASHRDRCSRYWAHEHDGHKLCTRHLWAFNRNRLSIFGGDDPKWLEDAIVFFRNIAIDQHQ
jgi:hypothetical protein